MSEPQTDASAPVVIEDTVNATRAPTSDGSTAQPNPLSFLRPAESGSELGRLGPFRVTRLLGEGGMGAVFAAEDALLKRNVALKVMRLELMTRPEARERFVREAQAAAAVEHDHITPVFQVGEDNGVLFIAMPLLQGEPLDARLTRDGRLPVDTVLKIGREVAEALAAAHAAGLIHRDIKPANLWLEGTPGEGPHGFRRVKVLDFGLARLATDDARLTGNGVVGTPAYMSPEQAGAKPVDHRTDLFSLGGVLYRCLTGNLPFPGSTAFEVLTSLATDAPSDVSDVARDTPRPLNDLVMKLLSKDPAKRPASAAAVAQELGRLRESLAGSETLVLAEPIEPKPRRRWPVAVAALLFGLIVVIAGVIVVKVRGPDGKETEVRVPEGSKVDVDEKGNVTVTLPGAKPAPSGLAMAPMPRPADGPEFVLKAGDALIDGFVILPDGNTLVAGYRDNHLRVWDLAKREVVREWNVGGVPQCLTLHPDGKTVAVLTDRGALFTWDATTGEVVRRYTSWLFGPSVGGWAMDFALGGEQLIVPDDRNRVVRAFDTDTGESRVLHRHSNTHALPRTRPNGREVAISCGSESPVLVNASGAENPRVIGSGSWQAIPAFSPNGKSVAFFGWRGYVYLNDIGAPGSRMLFEAATTFNLAFSPDGSLLAGAGGAPGEVRVWAARGAPEPVRAWKQPAGTGGTNRAAFTPDGTRLVTCHDKGTICVFRVRSEWGEPRKPYPPVDPAWLARVHKLSPDEQVKEVSAELMRRNPGFDGTFQVEKGVEDRVFFVQLPADTVADLTPVRGFPYLTHLQVVPKVGPGKLWDLSPLAGLKLLALRVQATPVWDIGALKGMPLAELFLDSTLVHDLSPLAGSAVKQLALTGCPVADLGPLKGGSFDILFLHNCVRVTDFSALRGATVRALTVPPDFRGDLTPLVDLSVENLSGMSDTFRVSPEQRKALSTVKTLKTINGKPIAEYWKENDALPPEKK